MDSFVSYDVTTPILFLPVESPERCLIGRLSEQMAAIRLAPTHPPVSIHSEQVMFGGNFDKFVNVMKFPFVFFITHQNSVR